jgi:hypothetical protein
MRSDLSKFRYLPNFIAALASAAFGSLTPVAAAHEQPPVGTYLWFPDPVGPKSDQDCRDLVARVQPSEKKAEMLLWGAVPDGGSLEDSFYLILSESRMEPTYAAEGDYNAGTVTFGETVEGETPFQLVPDDHPDMTIEGTIVAKPGSEIVVVTLRGIPLNDGAADRTTYYCRFEEPGTET